jgi:thiosulfate reductase/polysulfide reductase chain A
MTYWERYEMMYMPWWYNQSHATEFRQPLVSPPVGSEVRHSNETFIQWGKAVMPEYFDFEDNVAYYDRQLAIRDHTTKGIVENGCKWSPGTVGYKKYERDGGFKTPSGKVHLYWEQFEDCFEAGTYGTDQSMPRPDLAMEYLDNVKEYPLYLINYRTIWHQGSGTWTHDNPLLRDKISGYYENPLFVNKETGKKLGIKSGDVVTLEGSHGTIKKQVKLTECIRPDCVSMHHGFGDTMGRVGRLGEYNVSSNEIIPDAGSTLEWQDCIGAESHCSCMVRIVK